MERLAEQETREYQKWRLAEQRVWDSEQMLSARVVQLETHHSSGSGGEGSLREEHMEANIRKVLQENQTVTAKLNTMAELADKESGACRMWMLAEQRMKETEQMVSARLRELETRSTAMEAQEKALRMELTENIKSTTQEKKGYQNEIQERDRALEEMAEELSAWQQWGEAWDGEEGQESVPVPQVEVSNPGVHEEGRTSGTTRNQPDETPSFNQPVDRRPTVSWSWMERTSRARMTGHGEETPRVDGVRGNTHEPLGSRWSEEPSLRGGSPPQQTMWSRGSGTQGSGFGTLDMSPVYAAHVGQAQSGDRDYAQRDPELRRDRENLPKLQLEKGLDPTTQMDRFDRWLNMTMTAIATWSTDAEIYWMNVVKATKDAYAEWASLTPAERASAGGSASRLLGLRMPTNVPLIEKVLRAELMKVLPSTITREASLRGVVNCIDVLTIAMQLLLPSEAHVRVSTLDGLETPMKPARTFTDALTALRTWHYKYRVAHETFKTSPEPRRAWMAIRSLVSNLTGAAADFALEWNTMVRDLGLREGATMRKVELLVGRLEAEISHRAMEEGVSKQPPQDRARANVADQHVMHGHDSEVGSCDEQQDEVWGAAAEGTWTGKKKEGKGGMKKDGKQGGKRGGKGKSTSDGSGGKGKDGKKAEGKGGAKSKGKPSATCPTYLAGTGCEKGDSCTKFHPKMPDRCYVCGNPQHRSAECPHKRKKAALEAEAEASPQGADRSRTKHSASAVSVLLLGVSESDEKSPSYLFDSGATHVLLPVSLLSEEDRQRSAQIRLKLAAGKDATGVVVDGEIYAPGVTRSLLPAGRVCHALGVSFVWDHLGPRLLARSEPRWLPVIWMKVRGGLPCVSELEGDFIRRLLKDKSRKGEVPYSVWKKGLNLPDEGDMDLRIDGPPGLQKQEDISESSSEADVYEVQLDLDPTVLEKFCDDICLHEMQDEERKERVHQDMELHRRNDHHPKRKDCKVCQESDGPVLKHKKVPLEEKGLFVLHADLSGPHREATNSEGKDVSYALIAVLRLQSSDLKRIVLLPWVRTIRTKEQGEVLGAMEEIIVEIEGASLAGIPYGGRVKRVHTDRGTEWLNRSFQTRMQERGISHTTTRGYSPQSNGTAERFVGILKTIGRRLLHGSHLSEE